MRRIQRIGICLDATSMTQCLGLALQEGNLSETMIFEWLFRKSHICYPENC